MPSEAELFCIKHKIPIPLMKEVWGSRHRIQAWQIDEAAEEYWQDVKHGRTPEPESIDAGWHIMRRARLKMVQKIGNNMAVESRLKSQIDLLNNELAFAKLPWYKKLNWRIYKNA